jgi:hypothetical protein
MNAVEMVTVYHAVAVAANLGWDHGKIVVFVMVLAIVGNVAVMGKNDIKNVLNIISTQPYIHVRLGFVLEAKKLK